MYARDYLLEVLFSFLSRHQIDNAVSNTHILSHSMTTFPNLYLKITQILQNCFYSVINLYNCTPV
jgi:hypothetical protein